MSTSPIVYREGMLYKRQRGLKTGNARKLKFQERFCRLTNTSLDYYDPNPKKRGDGPKGQFAVEQIKVAEAMEKDIFGKDLPYAFQIGDSTEVMYFVAKSKAEMDEWLGACRHVAKDGGNVLLSHHHHGVFGLLNKGRWSCCANPRRACPGCSPSTLIPEASNDTLSTSSLPKMNPSTSQRSLQTPSPLTNTRDIVSPRSITPSRELETGNDTSSDESMATPSPKILVRRFTLADPLMMPSPGTPQKFKELSKSKSQEKEDGQDTNMEKQQQEEVDNEESDTEIEKTNNSFNSLSSLGGGGGGKGEQGGEREEVEGTDGSSKDSVIGNGSSKGDSSSEVESGKTGEKLIDKELKNQRKLAERKKSRDIHLLANLERTGASSPSPSVDSGRGVSRPNSQIDVGDLRISRTESVGKKSVQSVVAEQGAKSDVGRDHTSRIAIVEETDNDASEVSRQVSSSAEKKEEETERKYQDLGGDKSPKVVKLAKLPAMSHNSPRHLHRKVSSPPAPDMILRRSLSPEFGGGARPMSFAFAENESSESELSRSFTPQHRKLLASMASGGSPKADRPKSMKISPSLEGQEIHQCSRLHQACKDGNLQALEEELNKGELLNLDEPASYLPIPHTPLFIAYINDHYQIMMTLLEHGANPDCEEPCEQASLLQWASSRGCLDVVDLLIKYKADVNKRDCVGNTPLMDACKNGHYDVVELLLENGANVDDDSSSQRTALHESTEGEHVDITELLLKQSEVDPTVRDAKDKTPYDIAYAKRNEELMQMLQMALPKEVRPYTLKSTKAEAASQMITTVGLKDTESIITGSRDCQVKFHSSSDLTETFSSRLTDTVLDMSLYSSNHLIIGSTSIQLLDLQAPERRQIVADDAREDEDLHDPPLHLVRFSPKGRLVTASVESNVVKLWPAPSSQNGGHIRSVQHTIPVGETKNSVGTIYSLCISPDPSTPWLAVGLQPGNNLKPDGFKLVYCYDLETRKLFHIFEAGDGGLGVGVCTIFSPDGKKLAIGCSEHLCIWEIKTGNLLQKFTTPSNASILSLCYSPSGGQLAAGLSSGETQVYEVLSSSPVFILPPTISASPVTAVSYSSCGKLFASGHQNGTLRLWEV